MLTIILSFVTFMIGYAFALILNRLKIDDEYQRGGDERQLYICHRFGMVKHKDWEDVVISLMRECQAIEEDMRGVQKPKKNKSKSKV